MKRFITALLVLSLGITAFSGSAVFGKTITELQKEKSAVDAKEKEASARLAEIKSQKKSLTTELEALDIEIELAGDQLTYIHGRLDNKNEEHEKTLEELAEAEAQKQDYYDALKKRLKYIQKYGKVGYFQVLFNSKSFGDFLNRIEYVNDIVSYDQNIYHKLEEVEKSIINNEALIKEQKTQIELLLMEQEQKMLALEQSREAKDNLMDEIEADVVKYNQQIDELEAESGEIAKKIKQAQEEAAEKARKARMVASGGSLSYSSGSGVAPKGQYHWPVPGYYSLSSGFVNRTNPITGRREFHTGIDIPAPRGTNILAAEAGTVILSGTNGGYGLCVVIDHGNGVSTLYGHNSALVVSVGEQVSKGQTIAKCGSTGMSTGNHCHFEVRINGSPVSPGPYVGL